MSKAAVMDLTNIPTEYIGPETGVCAICRDPLTMHIDDKGGWRGCQKDPIKHPLRRESDGVALVPVASITAAHADRRSATKKTSSAKSAVKSKTTKRAVAKEEPTTTSPAPSATKTMKSGRGRNPGRYVLAKANAKFKKDAKDGKEPFNMTSIKSVFGAIASRKNGISAREISEKLKMPMGTVGWSLQHLKRVKAVVHQPAKTE